MDPPPEEPEHLLADTARVRNWNLVPKVKLPAPSSGIVRPESGNWHGGTCTRWTAALSATPPPILRVFATAAVGHWSTVDVPEDVPMRRPK